MPSIRDLGTNWVLDASILWGQRKRDEAIRRSCSDLLRSLRRHSLTSPRIIIKVPEGFYEEVKGARPGRKRSRINWLSVYKSPEKLAEIERKHGGCREASLLRNQGDWDYVAVALARQEEAGGKILIATRDSHFKEAEEKLQEKEIQLYNPTDSWEKCNRSAFLTDTK